MKRRDFMAAGAAGASSLVLTNPAAEAMTMASGRMGGYGNSAMETSLVGDYLDLTTPEGNREAIGRINGNIDMETTKFGWFKGLVHGVRPNEKVRDLFGFTGFSAAKLLPSNDPEYPGYRKVLREVGFYTDLQTGEVMEHWHNPYFDERVRVVPIANDPFNELITAYNPPPPSYGGLNTEKREKVPMILDWERRGNDLNLARRINLFYPAALQPDKWPRESGGKFNQVSEMFLYHFKWDEMQTPDLTAVKARGVWNRVTPWLPWMLMGPTEGHCIYTCHFGAVDSLEYADPVAVEYASKYYPKYLEAPGPDAWNQDSLSSLEMYSREQTPAPLVNGEVPIAPAPNLPF